eukprot:CAMPEP_0119263008 /NCGR_PEP_ID=MMETSP1329-20130426/2550_2 /TAXON_ID=114041 /ORGANISM="Genus nov. species nov., Strain RCC1024" /LENGTH=75 /DNA_ID=CAMNT_0007262697 /DNA_START=235 /DNA_END=459 /DNA_ORIENTATION=-
MDFGQTALAQLSLNHGANCAEFLRDVSDNAMDLSRTFVDSRRQRARRELETRITQCQRQRAFVPTRGRSAFDCAT